MRTRPPYTPTTTTIACMGYPHHTAHRQQLHSLTSCIQVYICVCALHVCAEFVPRSANAHMHINTPRQSNGALRLTCIGICFVALLVCECVCSSPPSFSHCSRPHQNNERDTYEQHKHREHITVPVSVECEPHHWAHAYAARHFFMLDFSQRRKMQMEICFGW